MSNAKLISGMALVMAALLAALFIEPRKDPPPDVVTLGQLRRLLDEANGHDTTRIQIGDPGIPAGQQSTAYWRREFAAVKTQVARAESLAGLAAERSLRSLCWDSANADPECPEDDSYRAIREGRRIR